MPNAPTNIKGQKGKGASGGKGGGGNGGGKGGNGIGEARSMPGDWPCHICGAQANRDWRERCRNCHAYRSVEMEKTFAEYAQRQLQQQRRNEQQQQQRQQQRQQQAKKDDEDRRQLRKQLERLQSELATVKAQQVQTTDGDDDAGADEMDDGDGYAAWSEDERNKRIDLAKGALAYAIARHGEESQQAQEHRDEIAALQKANREAKPFKAHRNQLERRRDELRRKQDRDEAAITTAKNEIAELQSKVNALQTAVEERAKQLKAVNDELNVLVRKALEEEGDGDADDGGKVPGGQTCAPWSALATAISGLAGQPGMPVEVAALLSQVHQLAKGFAATTAATQARPGGGSPQPAATTPAEATTATDAKNQTSAAGTPIVLAPHGRYSKAATAAKNAPPSPSRPQPTTPTTIDDADGGGRAKGGAGSGSDGNAAAGDGDHAGPNAARTEGGQANGESDAELLEDATGDGGPVPMDVEQSIAKLPDQDQRAIRAALRGRTARGQRRQDEGGDAGDENEERRERERSPRPTKQHDKDL